jgi:hypothetical protein
MKSGKYIALPWIVSGLIYIGAMGASVATMRKNLERDNKPGEKQEQADFTDKCERPLQDAKHPIYSFAGAILSGVVAYGCFTAAAGEMRGK